MEQGICKEWDGSTSLFGWEGRRKGIGEPTSAIELESEAIIKIESINRRGRIG
jgi:hypothetical protein